MTGGRQYIDFDPRKGYPAGLAFAVELDFLKGRDKFSEFDVFSLLHYQE